MDTFDFTSAPVLVSAFTIGYLILLFPVASAIPIPSILNRSKKKRERAEWVDSEVAMIHSIASIVLSAYVLLTVGLKYGQVTPFPVLVVVYHSFGYTLADTIYGFITGIITKSYIIHHLGGLMSLGVPLFSPYGGLECIGALFWGEMTNPCNLARTMLKAIEMHHTKAFSILSYVFVACFAVCRTYPVWWIAVGVWGADENGLLIKIGCSSVLGVSHHWLKIMFVQVVKRVVSKDEENVSSLGKMLQSFSNFISRNPVGILWLYVALVYLDLIIPMSVSKEFGPYIPKSLVPQVI